MRAPPGGRRLRSNIRRVMMLNAAWMFLIVMPVMVPFYRSHGLDMTDVYLLQTIFAVLVVALEVPSGYISDLFGRRRTLIVGAVAYGSAFTLLAISESFVHFVIFEVLIALATSLISGTDVALVYDSLEALGARAQGGRVLGRKLFWGQTGETVAALVGGGLATISLTLPPLVNACTAWIPLLVALSLVEPPRGKMTGTHRENAALIGRALFQSGATLRLILANVTVYGMATLLVVWSFQDYWVHLEVPLWLFGGLWAGYNLTVAVTGGAAHHVEARLGPAGVLVIVGLLPILGYAGMAATGPGQAVMGVALGLCFQLTRGLVVGLRDDLNQRVPTELRATANSIASLGVRLGFAALGPVLGHLVDTRGYGTAYGAFAGLYAVIFLVVCLPLVRRLAQESRAA